MSQNPDGKPLEKPSSPRPWPILAGGTVVGAGILVALLLTPMALWLRLAAMLTVSVSVILFLSSA